MILNLVDRRTGGVGQAGWVADNLALLRRLAVNLGKPEWTVNLVLVDEGLMTELNRQNRGIDQVTDVLSFSYLAEPADSSLADLAAGTAGAALDLSLVPEDVLSDEDLVAGELILAPGFLEARCTENGWPEGLEYPMLVVHGLLHVLGWDHQEEDERRAMQDIEENVLAGEELAHPLRRRS